MIGISGRTDRRPPVAAWSRALAEVDGVEATDAERIDALRELEELKAAAAAAQARITAAFDASQRATARPALQQDQARLTRSIAAQVALARRESPARGRQQLAVALALVHDLPHTHAALSAGVINEYRASLVARETAHLSAADRRQVDYELTGRLAGAGDRRVADLARGAAQRLDPAGAVQRARKAEADRRVTVRPAPDTMANLSALLPVVQGVAVYAALRKAAEAARAQGDPRSLSQLMADILVVRTTGQASDQPSDQPSDQHRDQADDGSGTVPATPAVEVALVMSERTLLHGSAEPAHVPGFGPLPGSLARQVVAAADRAWLRRLYAAPQTGELVAMDSRRRIFRRGLRRLVTWRDQTCRTPGCDAPVAHADHAKSSRRGGRTSAANGQGLCEACNYTKEAPGWRTDVISVSPHVVEITTPTGHTYQSQAPPQPGADPPGSPGQQLRRHNDDVA